MTWIHLFASAWMYGRINERVDKGLKGGRVVAKKDREIDISGIVGRWTEESIQGAAKKVILCRIWLISQQRI